MHTVTSAQEDKSTPKNNEFVVVQGEGEHNDVSLQKQRKDLPLTQVRNDETPSLLNAASQKAYRNVTITGPSITASGHPACPVITTTTNSTATTVTSTTTTAPLQRVTLLTYEGACDSPVWDHYTECAMLIHSTDHTFALKDTCGTELVRQIGRIPCTTKFSPADDAFIDGFIEVVKGTFASEAGIAGLQKEENSWRDYQQKASSAQQEKMSVWIKLFHYALMVATALREEQGQAGRQNPAVQLIKLRKTIDVMRRNLVRIHLGDRIDHDISWVSGKGMASSGPKADPDADGRRRAGSMTALLPFPSSAGGKKALPRLPKDKLAGFDSKEEALLAWKKKADKQFEKHHVGRSVLPLFEQSLGFVMTDRPDLYCIAYKFLASIVFAEWVEGIDIGDALDAATENELGYVNEILAFREKLRAVLRSDSAAPPKDKLYRGKWLDFFQDVGVLMNFRRDNRETPFSESPQMAETLVSCERAYETLVKTMREADDLLHKQDEEARAAKKSARAKERRLKGRSMDFLLPGKKNRAAQPSVAQDTDAIGPSPRKKIAKHTRSRERIVDDDLPVKRNARMDQTVLREEGRIREKSPGAVSLPDSGFSVTTEPTSPRAVSTPKKKSKTFEATQQEAGPVRAGEKKKARSRATEQENERDAEIRETGDRNTPGKSDKEKKEGKEKKTEKTEKAAKKDKASKGTKDD